MSSPKDFTIGMGVQTHPATDAWMRGFRYGEVVKIGRKYVHVRVGNWFLDPSKAPVLRFTPDLLTVVFHPHYRR